MASLVLGIVSFVASILGIVTAILAIVYGGKAQRAIRASGGTLGGAGMAKAGRILGIVYLCTIPLLILMAAIVFVLVQNLAVDGAMHRTATIGPGDALLQGFPAEEGATFSFQVTSTNGEPVLASVRPVHDWRDPEVIPGSAIHWSQRGTGLAGQHTFQRGDYALVMACEEIVACKVRYRVAAVEDPGSGPASPTTQPSIPAPVPCGAPATGTDPERLPLWEPEAGATPPEGPYQYVDSLPGDPVGGGYHLVRTGNDGILAHYGPETRRITVSATGGMQMDFVLPEGCSLAPGYHPNLTSWPFGPQGHLSIRGEVCPRATGAFAIDAVELDERGFLARLEMRFEQSCGGAPPLRGKLLWWDAPRDMRPREWIPSWAECKVEGPTPSTPGGLPNWQPGVALPERHFFLDRSPGDGLRPGDDKAFGAAGDTLHLNWFRPIAAGGTWMGFQGTSSSPWSNVYGNVALPFGCRPEVGTVYGNLTSGSQPMGERYPNGRFYLTVDNEACDAQWATLILDEVRPDGVTFRFEALCEGATEPVRGRFQTVFTG